ncbi:acyl-CoA thioesterase [Aquimarina rhabdastrellae]
MKIISNTKIKVRYAETDQMGVVHHGNYAQYLEVSRIEWLEKLGVSYKTMEAEGVMLPIVTMDLKFKKSAYFDDILQVKTMLRKIPTARIVFDYEIYNQNQELLTTATTTLVFLNAATKRPMACPDDLLEKIKLAAENGIEDNDN